MVTSSQLFIGGRWLPAGSGATAEVRCPADGKLIAEVSVAGAEDIDAAVRAAYEAFNGSWKATPGRVRGIMLNRLADLIERDATILALALMVPRALEAAERLKAEHGIDCEVVDVRSLVPLDTQTILGSVAKTHRLFTVEENPRLCGWGAEIVSIVADEAFYDLDSPPVRITTPHIPLPAADILEDIVLPTPERIVDTVRRSLQG